MTATALSLRPMRWWDVDAVVVLEDDLFAPDAWSAGLFWSELAQHDSRRYMVVVDGQEIVGYAGVAVHGPEAYIQTVGVARPHWGRGIGSALVAAMLAEADERGARTVLLEVRAGNARAQRLYERFGFATIGVRRGYYQPSGEDAHVMVRRAS